MIKLKDLLSEGKLTEGSLKQAMQQWKYIEKGLKPKQKKLVQKALKRLKPKMDKYFKNKDYQDYIDGELSIKVSLPDLVFGKGKEFGQLISAYSNAIKEPAFYKFDEGKLKEKKLYRKETAIDVAKRIVKNKQHEKGVDMQTANLIMKIYHAYDKNPSLQKKLEKMPLKKLAQSVWRFVK